MVKKMDIKKVDKNEYESDSYTNVDQSEIKPWEKSGALETKADMAFIIHMFGANIYHSDESAYREQLVNALSHGALPVLEAGHEAWVEVTFDYAERTIVIQDMNGMGIPWKDFDNICTYLGQSGNKDGTRAGQHGCGLFSFLKLSDLITFETWSKVTDEHYAFIGREGKVWDPIENRTLEVTGTKITIALKPEVEIDKIVHATKIIAGHFPVTTNLTIRNKSDSSLEDYGKIQDGTFTLGNRSYTQDLMERYSNLFPRTTTDASHVLKLEDDMLEFYIIKHPDTSTTEITTYLTNVPIDLHHDKDTYGSSKRIFDYDHILGNIGHCILHVKNERMIHPPVDRDQLNETDTRMLLDRATLLFTDYVKENVKYKTVNEWVNSDFKWLADNRSLDEILSDDTREINDEIRRSYYGSLHKDYQQTLSAYLTSYDTIFLTRGRNERLEKGIQDYHDDNELGNVGFINTKKGKTRHQTDDHFTFLESLFEYSSDYRRAKKIKLPALEVTDSDGTIGGIVKVYSRDDRQSGHDTDYIEIKDKCYNLRNQRLDKKPSSWKSLIAFTPVLHDMVNINESVLQEIIDVEKKGVRYDVSATCNYYVRVEHKRIGCNYQMIESDWYDRHNLEGTPFKMIGSKNLDKRLKLLPNVLFPEDIVSILQTIPIKTNFSYFGKKPENFWDLFVSFELHKHGISKINPDFSTEEITCVYTEDQLDFPIQQESKLVWAIIPKQLTPKVVSIFNYFAILIMSPDNFYFSDDFKTKIPAENIPEIDSQLKRFHQSYLKNPGYFKKTFSQLKSDLVISWLNKKLNIELFDGRALSSIYNSYSHQHTINITDGTEILKWVKSLPEISRKCAARLAIHYLEKGHLNRRDLRDMTDDEKKRATGRFAYRELTNPKSTYYLEFLKKGHIFTNMNEIENKTENLMYDAAHEVLSRWNDNNFYYTEKQELSQLIRLMNVEYDVILEQCRSMKNFVEKHGERYIFQMNTVEDIEDFLYSLTKHEFTSLYQERKNKNKIKLKVDPVEFSVSFID